ncbi:MAG TPA: anti-sigma factor [Xanthobacteraceae bacterium]|nr:anti-sigma factor [Xanthobacteraceae bacterium]
MTDRIVPATEDELHALLDGELPDDRRHEVEAWLASHPEDAARIAAWRAQADAIRARYGAVADEPVPDRFDLDRLVRTGRPWRRWAAAAAIIAFFVGTLAGWFGRGAWEGPPAAKAVVAEALDAHRLYIAEMRHPIEVPADASHLMPWLSRRLGQQLRAPDLLSFGLKLIGGRLLPGPTGPAALFMYEGSSGERFTLYCARARTPGTALRYQVAGQAAAFYWVEGGLTYVVSGPADRPRLQKVAESAYEQLEQRPPGRSSDRKSTSLIR